MKAAVSPLLKPLVDTSRMAALVRTVSAGAGRRTVWPGSAVGREVLAQSGGVGLRRLK